MMLEQPEEVLSLTESDQWILLEFGSLQRIRNLWYALDQGR